MKQYERYKESGVEWLGRVPEQWEIVKGKRLFQKMDRLVHRGDKVVTCFRDGQVTLREKRRIEGFTNSLKEIGYQGIKKGDLVIHNMDAFAGAIGVSDSDGKSTPVYSVCTPINSLQTNVFYYAYLLRTLAINGLIISLAKGIRERSTDFRFTDFGNLEYYVPPIKEQNIIVNFLDQKCAQIDKAISQKERVIELLNERRQIIIQRAVTRGLDPSVPMKESGVDWIGEIPEHWEVRKLKNVCDINPLYKNYQVKDNGEYVTFLPMEKVTEHGQYDNSSMERYKKICNGFTYFEINDIIMAKITPCFENGKGAFLDSLLTKIGFGSTEFHVLRKHLNIDGKFLYYIIKSYGFRQMGEAMMTGSAGQKRVPTHFLTNYKSAIPINIFEQQQIATYLDNVNAKIDKAIAIKRQEIEKLKEYKTVLIDAAVTGKIKIA